jgi:methylated-DNA-[protein]-cysteine S-methyltransferase
VEAVAQLRGHPCLGRDALTDITFGVSMKFDPSIVQARYASPLGPMIVAATSLGVAGIWFEGQKHMPDNSAWPEQPGDPVLLSCMTQLDEYFNGSRSTFDLPLDLQGGTAFQQSVWQALLAIPTGATTSYGLLSQRIGRPAAMRAVGAAVGRNPVCIVVPCHRVLGAGGSLTGYAGGLPRKTALLQLEGAI